MNEVFLKGKIITDIEFNFLINTKNISIAKFEIMCNKQKVKVKAYNQWADLVYSSLEKRDIILVNGYLINCGEVVIKAIKKM